MSLAVHVRIQSGMFFSQGACADNGHLDPILHRRGTIGNILWGCRTKIMVLMARPWCGAHANFHGNHHAGENYSHMLPHSADPGFEQGLGFGNKRK